MSAVFLEVCASVRYWEDATVNGEDDLTGALIPFREGDDWSPVIRISDGSVMDWPAGTVADIHYKVCDAGEYWLLDESRQRIWKWTGHYVPDDFLCPSENGYGDYIILQISAEGFIENWTVQEIQWACGCCKDSDPAWKRIDNEGGAK